MTLATTVDAFRLKYMRKAKERILECRNCPLYKNRKFPVIGKGNHQADIVFVNEAAGQKESMTGQPFSGNSKETFECAIKANNLDINSIYMTTGLRCWPQNTNVNNSFWFKECLKHFIYQLETIKPIVVCTMGSLITRALFIYYRNINQNYKVAELHGNAYIIRPKKRRIKGRIMLIPSFKFYIVPTFNPADKSNSAVIQAIIEDVATVKRITELKSILFP